MYSSSQFHQFGALLVQTFNQESKNKVDVAQLAPTDEKNKIKVLHVDDDPSVQTITKLILTDLNSGFEIDTACCVDEGLRKLEVGNYDVVVSDYEMAEKNGLDFLKELREAKNEIPFILFTGKGREEVAIKALNLGADGYFNKQGSPETVYGELAHGIRTSFKHKKADESLKKSQAELNAIVSNAPLGIVTSDSNMLFKSANEAFCRIIGYSEDELQKRSFRDITYLDDIEISNKEMKELSCGNIAYFSKEKRYVRKDGAIIDGKVTVSAIRNNEGEPILYVAELEDITQSKQAEAELRGTFNVLERVGEGLDAGLAVIGKDYQVVWANKRLMDLGVSPNKKCYQTFNHSESVCADCGVKKIFEQNASFDIHEYKTVDSKGETIWIELRITPLKDQQGNVTAALELAVPITEHKRIQEILRMKEQGLENILDSSPTIVFYKDLNGKLIQANKAFAQALNTTKNNLLGKTVFDIYSAKIAQAMTDDDSAVLKSKTPKLNIVEPYESPTGLRWIRTNKIPTFNEKGEVTGLIGFSEEITDYRKTEAELKESLNNYQSLIDGMSETAWVIDFTGNFIDVNKAAVEVLGYSKEELMSLGVKGIDNYLSEEQIKSLISELPPAGNRVFETEHTTKDGSKIPVEISSSLVTYQGKQAILSIARNIIIRKKVEEKLKATLNKEKFLADLVRNASVAVAVGFPDGRLGEFNLAFEKLTGYNEMELKKVNWSSVLTPPEWAPIEKTKIEELERTKKPVNYEKEYIRKDGSRVPIELSVHPVFDKQRNVTSYYSFINDISQRKHIESQLKQSEAQFRQLFSSMPSGGAVYEGIDDGKDFVFKDFNSMAEKIENINKQKVIDKRLTEIFPGVESFGLFKVLQRVWQSGKPEYFPSALYKNNKDPGTWRENWVYKLPNGNIVAIYNEITERKKAEEELKKKSAKIEAANEKLNVVGRLTRHDVGNKLMVIKSNIYLLKKQIGDNHKLDKYLESIDSAINQSSELFEFSRFYEEIGVEEPSEIDVVQYFNQAATLFSNLTSLKIINECQGLVVLADSLLRQAFYNLIDNSIKHGEKVSQIRLHYAKEGDEIKLFYEDNGVGVPETNKSKLFQVGFTTGKGSGLGLYLIKKMLDVYGWTIKENGDPEKGAKFTITIPKLNKNGKDNFQIT
jgi:PAS domain S-box-containing protein